MTHHGFIPEDQIGGTQQLRKLRALRDVAD
jgi:hypothetical protein